MSYVVKKSVPIHVEKVQLNSDIVESSVALKIFTLPEHLYYIEGVM